MNNYFRDGVNFPPEITNRAVDTIQKQVLRYWDDKLPRIAAIIFQTRQKAIPEEAV